MESSQVRIAQEHGLHNVPQMEVAASLAGVPFRVACALFEKESSGLNIYGHDVGGALSTNRREVKVCGITYPAGADIPVTSANAAVFLLMIGAGHRSNGMGPAQITYAGDLPDGRTGGYFRVMLERNLLPWKPVDNMLFGLETLKDHRERLGSWEAAGTAYNGRESYGEDLKRRIKIWKEWLA